MELFWGVIGSGGIKLPFQCWIDDWFSSPSYFNKLSQSIGCHEAALRLVLSLILAYPLGWFYNNFLVKSSHQVKNIFFFVVGFSVGVFNYGVNILHTLTTIIVVYFVMKFFRGNLASVVLSFSFCTIYLLWGYYLTLSDEYAFEWTIPQCVLTLRLIAVVFDVYDGSQVTPSARTCDDDNHSDRRSTLNDKSSSSSSSAHWNEDALPQVPSLIHLLTHCYFPASFLVGPQFSLKQYINFVERKESILDKSMKPGIDRLSLGIVYMIVYQVASQFLPLNLLLNQGFKEGSIFKKLFIMTIVTKTQLCKYICIWLISEGSCILTGVTYDDKNNSFDKYSNVRVYEYETTSTFGGLIRSFNITTNQWAGKYIFKRLKFLRSKFLSHILTLLYLALWHGWKSGYYVTFTIEFLIMKTEWEVMAFIREKRSKSKALDEFLDTNYIRWSVKIFFRIYLLVVFGYCLIPFTLLTYKRWWPVLQDLGYFGHAIYIPTALFAPLLLSKMKKE